MQPQSRNRSNPALSAKHRRKTTDRGDPIEKVDVIAHAFFIVYIRKICFEIA